MKTKRIHTALALLVVTVLGMGCGAEGLPGQQEAEDVASEAQALSSQLSIYDDALAQGWYSYGWSYQANEAASSPVQSGASSVAVTFQGWSGYVMQTNTAINASEYNAVRFWIHGGTSGTQQIYFKIRDENDQFNLTPATVTLTAGQWQQKTILLSELDSPSKIKGLAWQSSTGAAQPTFYLDGVELVNTAPQPPPPAPLPGSEQLAVYAEGLAPHWGSWSWDTIVNPDATAQVHAGQKSLSAEYTGAWAGLALHAYWPVDATKYDTLRFWIHGGSTSGRSITLRLVGLDDPRTDVSDPAAGPSFALNVPANQWKYYDIPLTSIVSAGMHDVITGIEWQAGNSAQPPFYLDDISFLRLAPAPAAPLPELSVDVSSRRHAISPDIYGINGQANITQSVASALRLPVRRWGGNAVTRYNYTNDANNRAADYYFLNASETNAQSNGKPAWENFVLQNQATSTRSFVTVPMIGYVAKDTTSCSFPQSLYPAQTSYEPDNGCGNGLIPDPANPGSTLRLSANPANTSISADGTFVRNWVRALVNKFGTAASGGVTYYNLDNEPMLWNETHRDVHPNPVGYDELRDRTYTFAAAVKAEDSTAKILGPVSWGWEDYFYSALDKATVPPPGKYWTEVPQDRTAHGGTALIPWYLQQMQAYEQSHGLRILDYLDVHYYPSGDGVSQRVAGDSDVQQRRLRATRSLWDPFYIEEKSWVNETPVMLVPRMSKWVTDNYPGTKLAVSEYNFGGLESINGALAQADALGIFGREGLDLATLWWFSNDLQTFTENLPGAFAFRMFRNYDGQGHGFGDISVAASSAGQGKDTQDRLAIYAAERSSDGALTIMVVNKSGEDLTSPLTLSNYGSAAFAEVYRYSAANLGGIVREGDQPVTSTGFTATYPANSVTLFVLGHGHERTLYSEQLVHHWATFLDGYSGDTYVNTGVEMPAGCSVIAVNGVHYHDFTPQLPATDMVDHDSHGFSTYAEGSAANRLDVRVHAWHNPFSAIKVRVAYTVNEPDGVDCSVPSYTIDAP